MIQQRPKVETIDCARAMRDGGIDAMAALDMSLAEALSSLSSANAETLKLTVGQLMSSIIDALITPALAAYPELEPDTKTWEAIAKSRAAARAN